MLEKQLNVDSDPLLFGRSLMKRSVRSVNSHMVHYLVFCCKILVNTKAVKARTVM